MQKTKQQPKSAQPAAPGRKKPSQKTKPGLEKRGGVTYNSAPAAIGESLESFFKVSSVRHPKWRNCERVKGRDFVTHIQTPSSGDIPGRVLSEIYISPNDLGLTRLSQFATLYEKYIFEDFKIRWVPAVGSATNGSIIIAPDRDIQDATPVAGETALRQFMAYEGAKAVPVWRPEVVDVPLESPDQAYYTSNNGVEDRLAYQGQVYVATAVPVGVAASTTIGSIWIEYDAYFFVPQLELDDVENSYTQSVGASPTTADAFSPFAPAATPTIGATNNNAAAYFVPPVLLGGQTQLKLEEGVWDMLLTFVQNQAGGLQIGTPTITANTPMPAAAPQPIVKFLANSNSGASGNSAIRRTMFDVPKGGASVTLPMTLQTGMGATGQSLMQLSRISDYLPAAAFNAKFS